MAALRMNITVPEAIKARMDSVTDDVNWSSLAVRAFEAKLGEIAAAKKEKTMQEVIERLRADKLAGNKLESVPRGLGADWARNTAHVGELTALERLEPSYWESEQNQVPDTAWTTVAGLVRGPVAFYITNEEEFYEEWWREVLGPDMSTPPNNLTVEYFVKGAMDVWRSVKDQI